MNNPINYWYQKYLQEKQKNEGMIEALRTEYEKGRADVIEKTIGFLDDRIAHDSIDYPMTTKYLIEDFKKAVGG